MNEKEIIKTLMNKSSKFESSEDIDALIDDVVNRITNTANDVRNRLITAYRNNEEKGWKDLQEIYSFVEDTMEELLKDVDSYTHADYDNEED